jgi:PAS domain S-box-containing protein
MSAGDCAIWLFGQIKLGISEVTGRALCSSVPQNWRSRGGHFAERICNDSGVFPIQPFSTPSSMTCQTSLLSVDDRMCRHELEQESFSKEREDRIYPSAGFITAGQMVLVGILYYVGAKIGFLLTLPPHAVSTLWPTNAILMTVLLFAPRNRWWLILLAALPAHLAVELGSGVPTSMVFCWFVSNCAEALIGAGCLRRFGGCPFLFGSLRGMTTFIIAGAFFATFASSFLDAAFVTWIGWGADKYWDVWRMRFLSNILAALTVVPVLTMVGTQSLRHLRRITRARLIEATVLAVGLLAAGIFAFNEDKLPASIVPALVYFPLPFLLWAAVRFGPAGLSSSILVIALLAITGAIHGLGPFSHLTPVQNVFSLQIFLIVMSVPLMLLAAVVHERHQTERALNESRNRLKSIFDGSMDGILLANDRGYYVDANASACGLVHLPREELLRKSIYDLIAVSPSEDLPNMWRDFLRRGQRVGKYALRCADGSLVDVECYGVANIQPGLHLFVVRDLSERKNTEQALAQSERRYREVVEAQTELVCRYLPDTTLTFVNDAYCRFFGKRREELLGTSFLQLFAPAEQLAAGERVRVIAQTPETISIEREVPAADGNQHWLQWTVYPTFDDLGQVVEFQAIARDVTERREAEESLRTSHQQISDLAIRLVHAQEEERKHIARELHDDFNQRLAAHAIGLSNLKEQLQGEGVLQSKLEKLRDEAVGLSDELRLISHEIHPPDLERADLASALRAFCREFGTHSKLQIDLHIEGGREPLQPTIALCCYRVVQEALRNVSKHAHATKVRIGLYQAEYRLVLLIADDGAGLKFEQNDAPTSLGIRDMRERVKLLRGDFYIGKRKDVGTMVAVELPIL